MTFPAQNESAARPLVSIAGLAAWLARAKPGAWLEYHRGLLTLDRIKGTSALNEAERRKLAAVADHALALADLDKLHLLQKRHGEGDYSYWAIARAQIRDGQA